MILEIERLNLADKTKQQLVSGGSIAILFYRWPRVNGCIHTLITMCYGGETERGSALVHGKLCANL